MKRSKLVNTKLSDYIVTTDSTADQLIQISCAQATEEMQPVAKISLEGQEYVINAQTGNYLSANKLSVISYAEYSQVSATLTGDGVFYFTYD